MPLRSPIMLTASRAPHSPNQKTAVLLLLSVMPDQDTKENPTSAPSSVSNYALASGHSMPVVPRMERDASLHWPRSVVTWYLPVVNANHDLILSTLSLIHIFTSVPCSLPPATSSWHFRPTNYCSWLCHSSVSFYFFVFCQFLVIWAPVCVEFHLDICTQKTAHRPASQGCSLFCNNPQPHQGETPRNGAPNCFRAKFGPKTDAKTTNSEISKRNPV